MSDFDTVRTRFAPSPSGHLHVGGARTALFNWAFARRHGGQFILRIEDTDQKRSSDQLSLGFMHDLAWLGIDWDEGPSESGGDVRGDCGPYFQSQRLDIYNEHLDRLLAEGEAYRAFETPEQLDAARVAAREAKQDYRYDRAALNIPYEEREARAAAGEAHIIRLRVPDDRDIIIHDDVLGDVTVHAGELDDFVIRKADGYPTYHFAVVVDDALMRVSHVIRGQEHLKNSAKHMLIQQALGLPTPHYAHISLIFNPDGSKMSKRDKAKAARAAAKDWLMGDGCDQAQLFELIRNTGYAGAVDAFERFLKDKKHDDPELAMHIAEAIDIALPEINVSDFRASGYLPQTMINYLALLGWSPGGDIEQFDADFLVERFGLDRVIKSPAKFDRDKLLSFSLETVQAMAPDAFADALLEYARAEHPHFIDTLGEDRFRAFALCNQARSKTLADPFRDGAFFIAADDSIQYEQTKPVRKALVQPHLGVQRVLGASVTQCSVPLTLRPSGASPPRVSGRTCSAARRPRRVVLHDVVQVMKYAVAQPHLAARARGGRTSAADPP
jgi:glutamyl/glutaminyl-tRNA synthetase